ncbi:MAG: DUF4129 domain-containing protein [Chloroflexota bacterium]
MNILRHTTRRQAQILIVSTVFLWFWLFLGMPLYADDPSVSLEEYWQMVATTRDMVAELQQVPPVERETQLKLMADEWVQVTNVVLPNHTQIPVDHSFLVAQLRKTPPDLARLENLLTTLLAHRQAWSESGYVEADMESLQVILAQSEFQWVTEDPSALAEFRERILNFLGDLLEWLLPENTIIAATEPGTWISYLISGFGALALAIVFFFLFREVLSDFVSQAEFDPDELEGGVPLTAETALARANDLSSAGDYRTAIRYLYLSSLLHLDERGVLRYDRSRTNREYLRSVADTPDLAQTLREVIDIFDRTWYGFQPVDEPTYTHYAARVAELGNTKKVTVGE